MMSNIPLALYFHIPWCIQKCPYCDFNSHAVKGKLDEVGYVSALLADLDYELTQLPKREVESIFIGGGTPSLFSANGIKRLLDGVQNRLSLVADAEITLEANPGTLETGRYAGYREAGVNRLSLGVQSFDAEALLRLGRIHGPEEAVAAVKSARSAGFDNFNIDLMFGLPEQTVEQAQIDLERVIGLAPTHISYYQLTLEPNTLFYRDPPILPEDELLWNIQVAGQALLQDAGYHQYEVSAYAQTNRRCRHNLNYWHFGDYLGIGAGAHGKVTHPGNGRVERRWRLRSPADFIVHAGGAAAIAGSRELTRGDLILEFLMNALRLTEGFNSELFSERTGLGCELLLSQMERPVQRGLVVVEGGRITPTALGAQFLDDLLSQFCDDDG
ncbi:MAG: radical SAM family heme chaperone HemW [Candidatus Sedimenticola sp. (ex Thyasira tokunagai)]